MKKILLFLFLLIPALFIPTFAYAADVGLIWDPNPPEEQVTEYCVYEQIGSNFELKGCTPDTQITVSGVNPGKHTYVATAKNMWGESGKSDPWSSPPGASNPKNLHGEKKVTITVEVQ